MDEQATAVSLIFTQYGLAVTKHGPFPSAHHFAGVMLEEWDEFRDELRADNISGMRHEAAQMAAVCMRFLVDINIHDREERKEQSND